MLFIVVVLLGIRVFPAWRHSSIWGYFPSEGRGLVFLILPILVLTGRL